MGRSRFEISENNGAVITENIEAEQQLHLEQCQHVLKQQQQQQQQQQQFVELSRQEEVSLSQQVQTLPNDVDVESLGSVQVESESQEEECAPSHNASEVSTNVKCEPDVLIKVEEMANLIARDSDIDTEIESDSASEDSEGNDAEDHRASTPLGVEQEKGGDYLAEASTSQDLQRLSNCEGAANSYEGADSFMTPATNGLLLLSCPQKTEGLETGDMVLLQHVRQILWSAGGLPPPLRESLQQVQLVRGPLHQQRRTEGSPEGDAPTKERQARKGDNAGGGGRECWEESGSKLLGSGQEEEVGAKSVFRVREAVQD
uniref:Uncharacterized protein n=1 Tax=Timema bartmani TaxID=61472 RepID=A0A7R9HWU6_9NEOP|nr:unnamed protein product [Timema bartmani]